MHIAIHMAATIPTAILLASCSDAAPDCDISRAVSSNTGACRDALIIALRETPNVSPAPAEVASVYSIVAPARAVACISPLVRATYDYFSWDAPFVLTSHTPLLTAWSEGRVETEDPEIDAVFAANGAITVEGRVIEERGAFTVRFDRPVSYDTLRSRLAAFPDSTVDMLPHNGDQPNVTRERVAGGWNVVFRAGWGDCASGCTGLYDWIVFVSDDLTDIQLVDERGDEQIPSDLLPSCR